MSKLTDGFEDKCRSFNPSFPYWGHDDGMELLAHARALEEMLRKHGIDSTQWCRECERFDYHAPDCELAKLLE